MNGVHDSTSRSPRANNYQTQSLHRQPSRHFDAFNDVQNNLYNIDDLSSRYDSPRYNDHRLSSTMSGNSHPAFDMGAPQAWNSSSYGHNNNMAALNATTRVRHPARGVRAGLPQLWLDNPQSMQPPNGFGAYGAPASAFSPLRHDSLHPVDDDDLIPTAIVIKNIPFAVKKEQLMQVMTDMHLPLPYAFNYHFDNGVFRGLAFANFTSPDETAQVIQQMNHLDLQGRKLRVEYKKMLPQAERDRIEREKRERRGQLEEQHRPINSSQLQNQPSLSSMTSSHLPATSPSPNSARDVDMNDPITLGYYSKLILFQGDPGQGDVYTFAPDLPATHRRIVHSLAHQLGLIHESHGTGEQRQLHVYRQGAHGLSPTIPSGVYPLDANRRQLNRAATTDFSAVRGQQDPSFYASSGNQSAGFLGFSDTQSGLGVSTNLRAAKSFADLRSYTPSPAHSVSSFPTGLTSNLSRYQETTPGSPGSQRSNNFTPTNGAMAVGPDSLLNGMGAMNLGNNPFGAGAVSPHRLRGMVSWERDGQGPGPGTIGGHRNYSTMQDEPGRNRGQAATLRQARNPMADRGHGFSRGRQNGHQTRGSDELPSPNGVEIAVE